MAAAPGFAPGPTESEAVVLLITLRSNDKWSPGKVLPPRLLGVGQTRFYFTTGRKLCSRQDLHLHWRRSQRRASTGLGYASINFGTPERIRTFSRAPVRCFPRIRRSLCQLSYQGMQNGGTPWACTTTSQMWIDLFSKQTRLACPVDVPENWSAWGELHSQGYSVLSRTGLLFPVNHTPIGAPGLAPGRLSDFKSLWSAVPNEARRRRFGSRSWICTNTSRFKGG